MADKILEVKDLKLSFKTQYGILQAIRGVSFDLYKGETLAIVGESGSGKSVTARSIMGLLAPNAIYEDGSIMYQNQDIMQLPEEDFHQIRGTKISMIFQDPMSSLNPIMRVGRQISEALRFKLGMPKKMAKKRAIELMELVGITDAEKRYTQFPFQFSGGMRQRIVISIALANNAEILICDEPTTALDVTIQGQILDLINKLKKERNLSVIFITHDLGVVANVADRIAVMYAGKIVEVGTAEEVFYNPKHPYTWALLSSMPNLATSDKLDAISGTPPNMIYPPKGDAFAPRNQYALEIDFEEQPPLFKVSETHYAATWLLHPDAPKVELPSAVKTLQENRGVKR
ncbi:MAG: ABC transporter ATP-binding protein [Acholeplasmataceae bacterium]|jgi:oligopeptide transport system ATP-binding protein|nr:ABC transporter ATP-binding protein [Acholeplasmataceae bacterium]MDD4204028.1 ABC transporter ATP-binding protein [Acholeplasmataceae bacterium]MDD4468401.1 ABC transporter ATP-binding protein [Acholeplasmataceae bacterium]MDD4823693.1 ABC transporter ATP-binding protein [Acholeplasmataceae bacterium]